MEYNQYIDYFKKELTRSMIRLLNVHTSILKFKLLAVSKLKMDFERLPGNPVPSNNEPLKPFNLFNNWQ